MSEIMAELYEQEFPGSVGKKLAALARQSEKLLERMDELIQKINSKLSDTERSTGLVREFVAVNKQYRQAVKRIDHELRLELYRQDRRVGHV